MNANTMRSRSLLLVLALLVTGQQHIAKVKSDLDVFPCQLDLFRLPANVRPRNYIVNLEVDPVTDVFFGKVEISLYLGEIDPLEVLASRSITGLPEPLATDPLNIILNIDNLKIKTALLSSDKRRIHARNACYDQHKHMLVIRLKERPKRPLISTLIMTFEGVVETQPMGLYRTQVLPDRWMLLTRLETAYTRRLFPCFDEPEFRATFKITVAHPMQYNALSNMKHTKTGRMNPSKQMVARMGNLSYNFAASKFKATPEISPHMLSLAVGNFAASILSSRWENNISIYAPVPLDSASVMHENALRIVDVVSEYFGQRSTLEKVDILAVVMDPQSPIPKYNLGLIFMPWDLFFASPQVSNTNDLVRSSTFLMNMMLRQRFAEMFCIHWWDERWFIEGLAAYVARELVDEMHPGDNTKLYTIVDTTFKAMNDDDQFAGSINAGDPKRTARQLEASFDLYAYAKSEAIVSMIAGFIGKANIRLTMQEIARSTAHDKAVDSSKWWNLLATKAPNVDMQPVAEQWVQNFGYPTIFINVHETMGRRVQVNQMPDLALGQVWEVPILYEFHGGPENEPIHGGQLVLEDLESWIDMPGWFDIDNEDHWITLNPRYQGYYRVVFVHPKMSPAVYKALRSNRLPEGDQMVLISNLYLINKKLQTMARFWDAVNLLLPIERSSAMMLLVYRILSEMSVDDFSSAPEGLISLLLGYD